MKIFCNHNWNKLSEKTTKSKFEHAVEVSGANNLPHQLACAKRKYIAIFSCEKCGKIRKFTEKI